MIIKNTNTVAIRKPFKGNNHEDLRDILLEFIDEKDALSDEKLIGKILSIDIIDDVIKTGDADIKHLEYALQFSQNIGSSVGAAKAAHQLGKYYRIKGEFKISLEYFYFALNNIPEDKSMEANIHMGLGNAHFSSGMLEQSMEYYYKALRFFEEIEDNTRKGGLYNNMGALYKEKGEYEKALLYYLKSLKIRAETNDYRGLANIYSNVGVLFEVQKDYKNALKYYEYVLKLPKDNLAIRTLGNTFNALGIVWGHIGDFEKSIEHIQHALSNYQKIDDESGMATCYLCLGRTLELKGDYHDAAINFRKALQLAESLDKEGYLGEILQSTGNLNYKVGAYHEAEEQLLKSYQIFKKLGMKAMEAKVSEVLANLYHDIGRNADAYTYMEHHSRLQKELATEEKTRLLAEVETRLELQQRDATIKNLKTKEEVLLNANQELELFAGRAAHDLKEPLRMMGSFSSILQRRYSDKLDDNGQEFLQYICDGANRMDRLLSDMLVYAKSGADPRQSVEVNLNDILEVVKSNLKLTIIEKEALVEIDELPAVKAVSVAMIQLFQNIIANALKFTKLDIVPKIQIKSTPYDEHFYQLSIRDNGIGIPEGKQEKVFRIFERAHKRESYEGTGIGLATCKKIVESLGGKIWLKSTEGIGTTFCFLLPKL